MRLARWGMLSAAALYALAGPACVWAQGIYTCIDPHGRRLTSDRPIIECINREQRVLNRDGSLQQVIPPTLTAEERARREADERRAEIARAARADAVRRDRNLIARYPDENAHQRAREAALDTVRLAIKGTEVRMRELAAERKPLRDESEFYQGRQMPVRLKQLLDANDAGMAALRQATITQELELVRVNGLYDQELARLRNLWSGAAPGSLPPVAAVKPAASSATR